MPTKWCCGFASRKGLNALPPELNSQDKAHTSGVYTHHLSHAQLAAAAQLNAAVNLDIASLHPDFGQSATADQAGGFE
jgi:hypothetical protein